MQYKARLETSYFIRNCVFQ